VTTKYAIDELNYELTQNLGRPRTVLDVGCGGGTNGRVARELGARVVGIDNDPVLLERAEGVLDEVHLVDPGSDEAVRVLGNQRFDTIMFAEVLDRASDPSAVVRRYATLLEDGGHVIAAIGASEAGKTGRSREQAIELLRGAGLEILRVALNSTLRAPSEPEEKPFLEQLGVPTHSRSPVYRAYKKLSRGLQNIAAAALPRVFAVQHVVVARKPPKPGKLTLTVGMLTYNEEESVEKMIDDIRAAAPDAGILCIDSSSDRTPDLARAKGAEVIRQLPPSGHGPAMEALMYEAANRSEALIYLDCDFTYPTAMIPRYRELLEEGADVVNGSRTHHYPKAMPVPNFLANRFFAGAARVAHGIPTTDVHSGMRGYRCSVIRAFDFDGDGDALPLDTLILPARSNYRVIEIPLEYNERVGFSKLAKLRGTVWTFLRIASEVGHGTRVGRSSRFTHREK